MFELAWQAPHSSVQGTAQINCDKREEQKRDNPPEVTDIQTSILLYYNNM